MKRALLVAILTVAAVAVADNAFAWSISVDDPLVFNYTGKFLNANKDVKPKDSSTTDVNGLMLGISDGWFGVGYENYEVTTKGRQLATVSNPNPTPSTFQFSSRYQLYDLFFDIPIPFLHPAIGYGAGQVATTIKPFAGGAPRIDTTPVSQTFLRLGFPFGPLVSFQFSYNHLTAQDAKVHNPGSSSPQDKFKASGDVYGAGLRVGW